MSSLKSIFNLNVSTKFRVSSGYNNWGGGKEETFIFCIHIGVYWDLIYLANMYTAFRSTGLCTLSWTTQGKSPFRHWKRKRTRQTSKRWISIVLTYRTPSEVIFNYLKEWDLVFHPASRYCLRGSIFWSNCSCFC